MITTSLFWHDYETSGADKQRDRPLQFAGIRTSVDLIPVGDPVMIYCKPSSEVLPQPGACTITGLTPQECFEKGVNEADFAKAVQSHLGAAGTCGVGYNSMRFDDEISRNLFFRNFYDPYEREWKNGNSRWDLIDVVRMCYALRPDGIEWPTHADGMPSFRLEDMAKANRLEQTRAHDALSDVEATIALARLIRQRHPQLFDYLFDLRSKQKVFELIDIKGRKPILHVSSFYPAERGCLTSVLPMAIHPTQSNGIVVVDLMADPTPLLTLDADALAERVFQTGKSEDGAERPGVSVIHANRSPALAPVSALKNANLGRIKLDLDRCRENHAKLVADPTLPAKLQQVFNRAGHEPAADPELAIYGKFPSDADKRFMREVRECRPSLLGKQSFPFQNPDYAELLFRYRARNWPEHLTADERERWTAHRRERLLGQHPASSLNLDGYRKAVAELRAQPEHADKAALFDALDEWGATATADLNPEPALARPKP